MKVWNYVFIAITMMILFEFMGFETGLSGVFNFFNIGIENGILSTFNFNLSDFMSYLFSGLIDFFTSTEGLFATVIGGGVAAGLIATGRSDIAIKGAFAGAVFAGFLPTLYFVLTTAIETNMASWAVGILAIIFIPFTIGFLFALVEYVVGGTAD
jgi:hypothetical protein